MIWYPDNLGLFTMPNRTTNETITNETTAGEVTTAEATTIVLT